MIEGTYDIAIDTPKHHKRGVLSLKSTGEHIVGRLQIGDDVDFECEGACADKDFSFTGTETFESLGDVAFEARGNVWGNSIDVQVESNVGKISIFGTCLSTKAGEFRSSHEYVMAASACEFSKNEGTMYSGLFADGG